MNPLAWNASRLARVSRVRISPSPPNQKSQPPRLVFLFVPLKLKNQIYFDRQIHPLLKDVSGKIDPSLAGPVSSGVRPSRFRKRSVQNQGLRCSDHFRASHENGLDQIREWHENGRIRFILLLERSL